MRGAAAQAEMTTQGANQRANMISQAAQTASSSAGNAIGGAVSQWKKTAAQADRNAGVLAAYDSFNKQSMQTTGNAIIPQEYLDSIAGEKNQDKVSGALMAISPMVESEISKQRQISVAQAVQKDQFQPSVVDLGNGRKAFLSSRGSAQLITDGSEADKSRPKLTVTDQGMMIVDQTTGAASLVRDASGNPVMPMPRAGAKPATIDPFAATASNDFKKVIDPVNARIVDLSAKVAGGEKYWGPDWMWPMGRTPYADQLRAEQARRDALMQTAPAGYNASGAAVQAGGAANTSSGGMDRATALKAAQDAIANGADPAAVNARLKQLGFQ